MLCTPHQKQAILQFIIPTLSNPSLLKLLTTSTEKKTYILQTVLHLKIQGKYFTSLENCVSVSSFCNLQSIFFTNSDGNYSPIDLSLLTTVQPKKIRKLGGSAVKINNFKLLKNFNLLESLELKICFLPYDEVFAALSSCSNLKKLKSIISIGGFNFDFSCLRCMTKLEEVSLRMQLDDYASLKYLVNLKKLKLENIPRLSDDKEYDFSSLQCLTQLTSLRLFGDEDISINLEQFTQLTNLQVLQFQHVRNLTTLSPLKHFKNVKILQFRDCSAIVDFDFLLIFPALQKLNIEHCTQLTDASSIRSLLSLTSLTLECTQSNKNLFNTLDFLRPLKKLNYLKLYNFCEIPDLLPLADLAQLKKLDLDQLSRVTDLQPLSSLKKLEELFLKGLPLLDLGSILSDCPSLKVISLGHCQELLSLHSLFNLPFVTSANTLADATGAFASTTNQFLADRLPQPSGTTMFSSNTAVASTMVNEKLQQNFADFSCALIDFTIEYCNALRSIDIFGKILSLRRFQIVHCEHLSKRTANSILKELNENKRLNGFSQPATMAIIESFATFSIKDSLTCFVNQN